jgi:sugar phosphate isomerase/epimerase
MIALIWISSTASLAAWPWIDRGGEALMDRLGIERLCVFGMPPVDFVTLAADLGCRFIGTGLEAMGYYNPHGYPDWSLKTDPALRREMVAAMRDRGVAISLCEGFGVRPDGDVADFAPDLDLAAELGAQRINVVSIDRDLARTLDGFAAVTEMAEARGLETTTEIGSGPISRLAPALAAVRHVGRPSFRLLIDTMHFFRLGGTVEEIAAIDPKLIGYVQLCDAPRTSSYARYMEEALHDRLAPGEGELPLLDFLRLVPPEVVVSVEVPQRPLAEAGLGPAERVGRCVEAARRLLAEAESAPPQGELSRSD